MDIQPLTPVPVSSLLGDQVVNLQGEALGKIEELMVDVTSGRIVYAVLSFGGGLLRLGRNKLFAIPWRALGVDTVHRRLTLNLDKTVLENAPGFDKDHWPDLASSPWVDKLHAHYGASPVWEAVNTR